MTNADKIRNMTDDELAELLYKAHALVSCDDCDYMMDEYGNCNGFCESVYLKWLQAEIK